MSSTPHAVHETRRDHARFLASAAAAILGLALIYLAGFAQADTLHDGAHDARHSAAFPCH